MAEQMTNALRDEFKRRYELAEAHAEAAKDLLQDPRYEPVFKGYFTMHAEICDGALASLLTRKGKQLAEDHTEARFLMLKRELFRGLADRPREMIEAFEKGARMEMERRKEEEQEEEE